MWRMAVTTKLRECREAAKLSVRQLARAVGVSHALLSYIEAGKRKLSRAIAGRVAEALGIPVESLEEAAEREEE